ncbi:MAG TPA: saccharopine dehydrogenase, partial [Bacteroides sp.]|nr:saccharopine dehydrogenase [Bacteroides sp.]
RDTDTLSMARTTGYTCTGAAGLLIHGMITEKGVIPPERTAVSEENFRYLMQHLRARGVNYRVKVEDL